MVAKKNKLENSGETPQVDMDRIKSMMGPLPDEKNEDKKPTTEKPKDDKPKSKDEPATAPVLSKVNTEVAEAAEEANASLKAMSDDLDKVTPNSNIESDHLLADGDHGPDATSEWLDSLSEPEAGAAPVVGDGVAGDDPKTSEAVEDIVAHEGDTVLEAEDEKRESIGAPKPKQKRNFKGWMRNVWSKPAARWGIITGVILAILATAVIPASRYYILNNVGIRASVKVTVVDSSTLQPLKNVTVSIGGNSVETDSKGAAKLEHLKLGNANLQFAKRGFTTLTQKITVGWGSNPQDQLRLVASGVKYSFLVTDYLSGKPIEKAEASSGEGDAVSDKNGKIVLSLDISGKAETDQLTVQIAASNYRTETVKITANNKVINPVKMVPARKDVFVSNRSGKYDLYTIDIDGKNEKKIVNGSGIERPDMQLVVQQNADLAALVATRENVRNSDGYLLSTLYFVDTQSGNLAKVDQSEQIQLIGWSSDGRLVYVKIIAGASGANPKRYRLISQSSKNVSDKKEIASANAFNDVLMAGDKVLYAPSNALNDNPNPGFFVVNADGTNSLTVTNKETYNIFRTDYSTVTINAEGKDYTYKIGAAASSLSATSSPTTVNRLYVDGVNNSKSLWVDSRDGKGLLLSYDKATQKDTTLTTLVGIKAPIFWLNDNVVVYRVNDGRQTADYAVSTNGGEAKKISDVSDINGIDRWYYY